MQHFLNLFIFTDALHVSGSSISFTVAGSSSIFWQYLKLYVRTVMWSWWWAEENPETYTMSVKINKYKKCCILLAVICNQQNMLRIMVQSQYKWYSWRGCKLLLVSAYHQDRFYCAQLLNKFPSTVTQFWQWPYHYWKLLQAVYPSQPCEIWDPHWCADVDFHFWDLTIATGQAGQDSLSLVRSNQWAVLLCNISSQLPTLC
jgi:hypothetical protein